MFKFKGISSKDMQVVVEEEEHFIAKASQRYEMTEIEGRDGAIFDELGYSVVERPIYVQCLNINKIDDILAWLNGEGEFEYKGRKTTARFYSQLEPQRSSCIRIIDTTFIRDPFWCKVNEDYQLVKDRKDKKASGEYIHVEDSSNCRGKIGISGNHEQETRSGKNYLNTLAKYKAGEKVTVDGITYIFNEDGSITCNGTATADSVLTFSSNLQTINGSGKKIVGMITGTQVPAKLSILAYTSDWSKNTFELLSSVNKNITINMQENIDYTIFRIIAYKGTTLNNQTIYYQILDTSVNDLTYEQYGASPSPNYPSEVKCVGSNENMFNKDDYIESKLYINKNENKFSEASSGKSFIFDISKYNKLTISKVSSERFGVFASVDYPQKDGVGTYLQDIATNATSFSYDFAKLNYLVVFYYSTRDTLTEQEILDSIKLEKGTVATPPSKHGQGCVKVTKCNKNIMPILNLENNYEYTENGIKSLKRNDGVEVTRFKVRKGQTIEIGLKMISRPTQDSTYSIYFQKHETVLTSFQHINILTLNKVYKKTYTASEDGDIFIKLWGNASSDIFEFQLWAELDNLTEYEQHEEQSYIMPVQKEMLVNDYLDYDNEEEVHVWKKLVFDGITNRVANIGENNSKTWARFNGNDWDKKTDWVDYENMKCTHFIVNNSWEKGTTYAKFGNNGIMVQFVFNDNNLKNIKDVNNWLKSQYDAGTPVIVYYKQQTPTRLPFTDEQKAVAKELNNARTYKNVTNITTDSKAILSLDYFTVTDEKIKNEGNVQSRPILRLEKTVSEAVDITINDVRFKYNFNNDKYVEIDCENKEVKFDGLERFRSIKIGYDFPKLNIGNNEITINDGDCIIKVIRKDRWL